MPRFKKKPVRIDAEEFTADNGEAIAYWCGGLYESGPSDATSYSQWITIPTLEGNMKATLGDYVIKGIKGEFYPCKPDIFLESYEPVAKETVS